MEGVGDINFPESEELHGIAEALINNEDPMEVVDRFNTLTLTNLIRSGLEGMGRVPQPDPQRMPNDQPNPQPNGNQNVPTNSQPNARPSAQSNAQSSAQPNAQTSAQSNRPQGSGQQNAQVNGDGVNQQNQDVKVNIQEAQQSPGTSQEPGKPKETSRNASAPKAPASGAVQVGGQAKGGRPRTSFRTRYYRKSVQVSYRVERRKEEQLVVETSKKITFAKKD